MNGSPRSSRIGGIAAILIGVLDILLMIYVVAIPAGQRFDMGQFFINYAENPLAMSVAWIVLATTSILAFAVVPAIYRLVHTQHEEWAQIAGILGIVGYMVGATSFLTMLGRTPALAQAYVEANQATRAAIVALGIPELDPLKVLVMGAPGVWFVVTNILAWRGKLLNRLHAGIGVTLGASHWIATLAMFVRSETLDIVAAGAGALFAPIWYVWLGIRLARPSA